MRKYAILAFGIAVCLMGDVLMAFGEELLGENHTGVATVIGIVGIGLVARSSKEVPEKQNHQREVC